MNNTKKQTRTNLRTKNTTSLFLLTAFAITLMTTACGSMGHRRKAMNEVLTQQNKLLRKIELQREVPSVSRKVQQDETLSRAEATLKEAIRVLRKSNEAVKLAL